MAIKPAAATLVSTDAKSSEVTKGAAGVAFESVVEQASDVHALAAAARNYFYEDGDYDIEMIRKLLDMALRRSISSEHLAIVGEYFGVDANF
ncbi:MAG: hypothetical protein Q4G39_03365 [Brachymonas sp.]|nr:hypothetical protein [Brachymonas sp.]